MLRASMTWTVLERNFLAWAQLENAEDLGRSGNWVGAIEALQEALKELQASSEFLQRELGRSHDLSLRELADRIIRASALRKRFCEAKILLSEARILDEGTDEGSSTQKRALAAKILSSIGVQHGTGQTVPVEDLAVPEANAEKAVGLEGVEKAALHAKLEARPIILSTGEKLELSIIVVNVGMRTARLVSLDGVIPDGLETVERPEFFSVEQSNFQLKGKSLDSSKSEKFKLVLNAVTQGVFRVAPRLVYSDEQGGSYSAELDAKYIVVSPIMKFLVTAFIDDYSKKSLSLQHAGWRTLMKVVQSMRIPRSQVYGDLKSGRSFAKPLETLVNAGMIESRIFPKERGRGGRVVKVRVSFEKEYVRRMLEELAPGFLKPSPTEAEDPLNSGPS